MHAVFGRVFGRVFNKYVFGSCFGTLAVILLSDFFDTMRSLCAHQQALVLIRDALIDILANICFMYIKNIFKGSRICLFLK